MPLGADERSENSAARAKVCISRIKVALNDSSVIRLSISLTVAAYRLVSAADFGTLRPVPTLGVPARMRALGRGGVCGKL